MKVKPTCLVLLALVLLAVFTGCENGDVWGDTATGDRVVIFRSPATESVRSIGSEKGLSLLKILR